MNNGKRKKSWNVIKKINQNKLIFCFYFVKCLLKNHYYNKI